MTVHALRLACALLLAAPGLSAQSVHGRVTDAADDRPVPGVSLTLADSTGSVVAWVQSGDDGSFRLAAPGPGTYEVGASRIGLAAVRADVLLQAEEAVEVRLVMAVEAVPLEPIVVVGRRVIRPGSLDEFYDRMARMRQRGKGRFLTRDELERRERTPLAHVLSTVPGVLLDMNGRSVSLVNPSALGGITCEPEWYLDGFPMVGGYRNLEVMDLEGVEVYRGTGEAVHGYGPSMCGVVMLWRRPDWGNPFTWGRTLLAVGIGALAFLVTALAF